jgi:predicted RNA-binding Zn ribbon-like protein
VAEAKMGQEFIKHELDEAIAIQRCIVQAEEELSATHPQQEAQRSIRDGLKEDQRFLKELERLGGKVGATGQVEEVAGGLKELMETTLKTAGQAESEAYEAHAVLLNLKRKQQDSAAAMVKIAREMKDTEMRDAASEFEKGTKESANELATQLSALAVRIATQDGAQGARA